MRGLSSVAAIGFVLTSMCGCSAQQTHLGLPRATVIAELPRMSPAEQRDALLDVIHEDALLAWSDPGHRDFDTLEEGDIAAIQYWAPAVDDLALDYVELGHVYLRLGDHEAALASLDRAFGMSEKRMFSATLRARVRVGVYRGREAVWRARGDSRRAKASSVLAMVEEGAIGLPSTQEADEAYESVLRASRAAQRAIAERAAAERARQNALIGAAVLSAAYTMQSTAASMQRADGTSPAAPALALQRQLEFTTRMTETFVRAMNGGLTNLTMQDFGSMIDLVPGLRESLGKAPFGELLTTDAGRQQLQQLREALEHASRGDALSASLSVSAAARLPPAATETLGRAEKAIASIEERRSRGELVGDAYWAALAALGIPQATLDELKALDARVDALAPDDYARRRAALLKEIGATSP